MSRFNISVVVPCFNAAPYLGQAVDSVLAQTFPPAEIFIVDDGSTDGSLEIAQRFGPPVQVMRQENSGPSAARNRGISCAKGDWIAFLDADDVWEPEKLERQSDAARPDTVCVHTYWYGFGKQQFVYDFRNTTPEERYTVESFLRQRCPLCPSSIMVRADIPARFPIWTRYAEDVLYFIELIQYGRFALVPEPLTGYRIHGSSATAKPGSWVYFHQTRYRWLLENRDRFSAEEWDRLQQGVLQDLVGHVWEYYRKRQWRDFEVAREYLQTFSGDALVDRVLRQRVYPAHFYTTLDLARRVPGAIRRRLGRLGGRLFSQAHEGRP